MPEPVLEMPSDSEEEEFGARRRLAVLRVSVQSRAGTTRWLPPRGVREGAPPPFRDNDEESGLEESPFVIEDDLQVQDICDLSTEEWVEHPSPRVPWPSTGRRLMEARSQACVVCLSDKSHTFVPPHVSTDGGNEIDSVLVQNHRLCTDCWMSFLRHGAECGLPALRCPVCRCDIDVPDVWCVRLGLEQAREPHADEAASPIAVAVGQPASESELFPWPATPQISPFWAKKRAAESPPTSSSSTPRAMVAPASARSDSTLPAPAQSCAGNASSLKPRFSDGTCSGDARGDFGVAMESWWTRGCCEMLRHDGLRRPNTPRRMRSDL